MLRTGFRASGISRVESGQTKNYVSNTGYWAHGALNSYALGNRPSPNTLYAVYSYIADELVL